MKLLVATDQAFTLTPAKLYALTEAVPDLEVVSKAAASLTAADAEGVSILLGSPDPALLAQMPTLDWLHLTTPDFQPYADLTRYANRKIVVTKSPFGESAAELVLALIFSVAQGLAPNRPADFEPLKIAGSAALVAGLGDLGQKVALRLHQNGCRLSALRRNILEKPRFLSWVGTLRQYPEAAGVSIAVNCLPLTAETQNFWNAESLRLLPPGGIFIHAGQDGTVDAEALAQAIGRNGLRGAAYDGPLPQQHPLRNAENTWVTPSLAVQDREGNLRRIYDRFVQLLPLFLANRLLPDQLQFFRGY